MTTRSPDLIIALMRLETKMMLIVLVCMAIENEEAL